MVRTVSGRTWPTIADVSLGSLYLAASHRSGAGTSPEGPLPAARRHAGQLLAVGFACLLALVLSGWVFVWARVGQRLDGDLLPPAERGGGYAQDSVLIHPARVVLSVFGDRTLLAGTLVSLLLLAVVTRRLWEGAAGVAVAVCSVAATRLGKQAIVRPDLGVDGSSTHHSFPSGHVAAAMGLLLAFEVEAPSWNGVPVELSGRDPRV